MAGRNSYKVGRATGRAVLNVMRIFPAIVGCPRRLSVGQTRCCAGQTSDRPADGEGPVPPEEPPKPSSPPILQPVTRVTIINKVA